MSVETVWFDGPCPFLLCLQAEGHSHPVCPACGAVRYGNLSCETCRTDGEAYRRGELAESKRILKARAAP